VLPWQQTCPDDGSPAVALTELPASMPAPPAHLLAEENEEADGAPPPDA